MNVHQPATRESCGIVTGAKLGHSRAPHGTKNKRTQLILHSLTPFLLARPGSLWPLTFCMSCPDPSLGGMSLPRAHPFIANYRPFMGAHNRTPALEMAGPGSARV